MLSSRHLDELSYIIYPHGKHLFSMLSSRQHAKYNEPMNVRPLCRVLRVDNEFRLSSMNVH